MSGEPVPRTPTEKARSRRRRWILGALALFVIACVTWGWWKFVASYPDRFPGILEHFSYGSIGSELAVADPERSGLDYGGHLPYRIWRVLPEVFPEHLPERDGEGYERFGFVFDDRVPEDRRRPIGFSIRTSQSIEFTGLNCALCHTGVLRTPDGERHLLPGAPSNTVDLLSYFLFLFDCALDARFTPAVLLPAIEEDSGDLGTIDELLYALLVVPKTRDGILRNRDELGYLLPGYGLHSPAPDPQPFDYPPFLPGRVDTFNPIKAVRLQMDMREQARAIGNTDFPSVWLQQLREGRAAHWDGNNSSIAERNISAALAAGAEPSTIDLDGIERVRQWMLELQPPRYPFAVDRDRATRGEVHYLAHCASCHGHRPGREWDLATFEHRGVGEIVPIDAIGTDRERFDAFTAEFAGRTKEIGAGEPWQFRTFRKTEGYVNQPLDGLWARAPYLHNGSVPTLWHLLLPAAQRPATFYRGSPAYDAESVGFAWQGDEAGREGSLVDTSVRGNGNGGHEYGVDLTDEQRRELLEFLKTL